MKYIYLNPEEIIGTPQFEFVMSFLKATGRTQLGWHYFIDLAWICSQVEKWPRTFRILDAGGGSGPTQFLLAELGFNVTNIDLFLSAPASKIQTRYRMRYSVSENYQETTYVTHLSAIKKRKNSLKKLKRLIGGGKFYQKIVSKKYQKQHDKWRTENRIAGEVGQLNWTQGNLCNLPEIATDSFDAVVSLSALEHIPIEQLPQAWKEIQRICTSEAKAAVTTSATEQPTMWFHQASQGWCFSEEDMKKTFHALPAEENLPAEEIIAQYRTCNFLKENIAKFYSKSGDNGMPWGKWDPKYFPVGLFR
ncbi:MAG: class I SAM-dependent methyltransferase [Candidatus Electrothrix sp. AR4]|nr:class I SAM-dependent methyltransferase [Candidatus Electrothrix sp. AR4]